MKKILISALLIGSHLGESLAQNLPLDQQIATAVLPLAEENRAQATVLGYDDNGTLKVIRKGSNDLICMADNPKLDGYNVSCYHKDLEPFMERGRELKKEDKSFKEVFDTREAEAKSGKLKMPVNPSTLYIMSGKTAEDANLRWVVYIPWATAESTGLPLKPLVPGGPWIMDPGTHRAHIMITPPGK